MGVFRAIDDFLIACEEYFDYRVKTGAFVKDLKTLPGETEGVAKKKEHVYLHRFKKSRFVKYSLAILIPLWNLFLRLPFAKDAVGIFIYSLILFKNSFMQQFMIFAGGLISYIILYNLFLSSSNAFFIMLLPLLFLDLLAFSALYTFIEKQAKGEKISLLKCFSFPLHNLSSLLLLFLNHLFVILITATAFFMFAFSLSAFYDLVRIDWTNSFFYWYVCTFILFLALFFLFVFNIVAYQAYFFATLEKNDFSSSLNKAWALVRKQYAKFLFFCFLFTFVFSYIIYQDYINNFPSGFLVSVFAFSYDTILLHYILRKRFISENLMDNVVISKNIPLLIVICLFGSTTFFLTSAFTERNHKDVINYITEAQENTAIKQQLTSYTNQQNGYIISYPKTWSHYDEGANKVIFYNNATGTRIGGIWLIVTVSPFKEAEFNKLLNTRPGLVAYDTFEKTVITKIYDYKQQGYDGVKYTYYKSQPQEDINALPITIYENRYLIHRGEKQYEIIMRTLDKNVEGNNVNRFEAIAKTFTFIDL